MVVTLSEEDYKELVSIVQKAAEFREAMRRRTGIETPYPEERIYALLQPINYSEDE